MNDYDIEIYSTYKDYRYAVLALHCGHRCGYVRIPRRHVLYGYDFFTNIPKLESLRISILEQPIGKRGPLSIFWADRACMVILFNVHGGITYSAQSSTYPVQQASTNWWVGFNCNHAGDGVDTDIVKGFYVDNYHPREGAPRSLQYVVTECQYLIEQAIHIQEYYHIWRKKVLFKKFISEGTKQTSQIDTI